MTVWGLLACCQSRIITKQDCSYKYSCIYCLYGMMNPSFGDYISLDQLISTNYYISCGTSLVQPVVLFLFLLCMVYLVSVTNKWFTWLPITNKQKFLCFLISKYQHEWKVYFIDIIMGSNINSKTVSTTFVGYLLLL